LELSQWVWWWSSILGPVYFILIVALYVARYFLPDSRILYEINETITLIFAATLSAAAAGLMVIVL